MENNSIRILKSSDIFKILLGKEKEIIELIAGTYVDYNKDLAALPFSSFLRFPEDDKNRIIALPAYISGIAGIKWISSFPSNINEGIERASAVILLNNMKTGRCEAVLDGANISAKRTAASAALAAKELHVNEKETEIALIGCGRINEEILRFICSIYSIEIVWLFDCNKERAIEFTTKFVHSKLKFEIVDDINEILGKKLISVATTAKEPYITKLPSTDQGATILHISLRDFSTSIIQKCDNVVDDINHVLRERTSLHLTEMELGNRFFIRCTLGDILRNKFEKRIDNKTIMFSPFGLGVLDLSLADYVLKQSVKEGVGKIIEDFQN